MFRDLDVFALYHNCSSEFHYIQRNHLFLSKLPGITRSFIRFGFEQVLNYHLIMSVSNIESIHDGNDGLN